jgi:uncharacterized membrane-anchored protein YjiN (DUF445 family)
MVAVGRAQPPPAPVMIIPGSPDDGSAGLRRMKRSASGLLAVAAAIFLATFAVGDNTAVGFVRAAAEAAMVGGVADWFAVTALFRHPLGLRIPHTALVPRKKDELATKLGEFVTENFLTPDLVAHHLADARLVRRAGERLADPATADLLAHELAAALSALLGSVHQASATESVLELVRRDLGRRSYAPVLGRFLSTAIEGRVQHPLVDLLVREARVYLQEHREELHPVLKEIGERHAWWTRILTTDRRVDHLLDDAVRFLGEMERDGRAHPMRRWLDGLLTRLADDLCTDPRTGAAVDAQLNRLVYDPRVEALLRDVVGDALGSIRLSLAEPGSGLERWLAEIVRDLGERIATDAALTARLESSLDAAFRYIVTQYGDQLVRLIRVTVEGWDARMASERIELAVGRDLQFIRINGTVVGALMGVTIHAVALLVDRL